MDATARGAQRAFEAEPSGETALAALQAARRAGQPLGRPLRWLLNLSRWDVLSSELQRAAAEVLSLELELELLRLEPCAQAGASRRIAIYRRRGRELALIPGGPARLGYALELTPRMVEEIQLSTSLSYFADLSSGFRLPRTVSLDPFLVEVEPHEPQDADLQGLRDLSVDEWEWTAGAGAQTLFRWGEDWPPHAPTEPGEFDEHLRPNAFGLRDLPSHPDLTEASADASVSFTESHLCRSPFLSWLPLATAYGSPANPDESNWFLPVRFRGALDLPLGQAPRKSEN